MKTIFFILVLFMSTVTVWAEESNVPPSANVQIQFKEDDVLLKFYDDTPGKEIIRINWNGTVEYMGELDYVSVKFWELLTERFPQFCQKDMIVSNPKEFDIIKITTMKGDIILKKDHIKNTMSVIHLNTLDEPTVDFWKAVEKAFTKVCK